MDFHDPACWAELLACPRTGGRLRQDGEQLVGPEGDVYPIKDGIPVLVTRHPLTPHLLNELFRYRRFFNRIRNGEIESDRISMKIDQIKEAVSLYRTYFESMVRHIDFSTSPLILDVAAGMCETSFELERRGARVIATDFSIDEMQNPRLYSFFETEGYDWSRFSICDGYRPLSPEEIKFGRIVSETERLPFQTGSFDIVFTRSSLHHVKDLTGSLSEMARVLKPGGQLVVAGECIRPPWESEASYLDSVLDYQEGIDEQMRTWNEYRRALKQSGYENVRVTPLLASSGKRLPKLFARMRLRDPFNRLEGKELSFPATIGLHGMGCVVGWRASSSGERAGFSPLEPAPGLSLAAQISEVDVHEVALKLEAMKAYTNIPTRYNARTLPRPEVIGVANLEDIEGTEGRRLFTEVVLPVRLITSPSLSVTVVLLGGEVARGMHRIQLWRQQDGMWTISAPLPSGVKCVRILPEEPACDHAVEILIQVDHSAGYYFVALDQAMVGAQ